ncbi:MAG: hypothetical protein AAGA99_21900 [Actinomycetota bacterium]
MWDGLRANAELLVAVLGLFVGGYAGNRLGALERMHVEDRRALVDHHLPLVWSAIGVLGPTPSPKMPARSYRNSARTLVANGAAQNEDQIGVIGQRVDLLPWADRVSWRRVADGVPVVEVLQMGELAALATDAATDQLSELPGRLDNEEFQMLLKRLADFDRHLRRQLRPGRWRQIQNWRYRLDLLRRGPWRV